MSSGNDYWNTTNVYYDWMLPRQWEKKPPKCECGTTIAMGKDDHPSFHSDYCEVRKEWELEEKLRRLQEEAKK